MALTLDQVTNQLGEITSVLNDVVAAVNNMVSRTETNSMDLLRQTKDNEQDTVITAAQTEILLIKSKLNLVIERVNQLSVIEGLGPKIDIF